MWVAGGEREERSAAGQVCHLWTTIINDDIHEGDETFLGLLDAQGQPVITNQGRPSQTSRPSQVPALL